MPEIKIVERPLESSAERWSCTISEESGKEHVGRGKLQSEALLIASASWYADQSSKR